MNPFLVPGCVNARTPLNPGVHGTHEDYADVDHTERQFVAFQEDFEKGDGVLRDGRLVVVSGPYGSGKTALVNRCVKWLDAKVRKGNRHPVVVDLRRDRLDRGEVTKRIKFIAGRLVDDLRTRGLLEIGGEVAQRIDEPDRMFPILSQVLGENTFLVILLPPSGDLVGELIEYARFARGKLLFFAETAYWGSLRERRGEFHTAGGAPPLFLELGPLAAGDGDTFWEFRLERFRAYGTWPHGDGPPRVAENKLKSLVSQRPMSIGELQLVLHALWELLRAEATQPEWISDEHFWRAYNMLYESGTGDR
ncbi:hypothetical protein AB0J74_37995 [Asanoa sp. NPDC049573]|uniref:hypothetical protein n=1 Tax=Asanoa sp. NPDC049573 TaxID=3155396 RepID=UPI0034233C58